MIDTRTNDPPNTHTHIHTGSDGDPASSLAPGIERAIAHQRQIDEFEAGVAEVCGTLHWAHARLVALTAEALEQRWWVQSGVRSPEHWLGWQTGVSPGHAARIVAAARRRDELPVTMAAFDAGELSLDQVTPIVAHAPAWADAEVCDLARRCTVGQIRAAVARYPFDDTTPDDDAGDDTGEDPQPRSGHDVDDDDGDGGGDGGGGDGGGRHPDDPEPEAPRRRHEFWSLINQPDGHWRATGRFDADHGAIIDAAVREITDAVLRDTGQTPSGVEVLVEMARRSLDAVPDRSRRDRYRVHVLLDERHQLVDPLGCALPTWLRDLITCDATMAVTWTRNGTPIAQGATTDTIPAAIRRHVLARDSGCRIPGCGRRARLDLHHVVHRHHGGTNDTYNLIAICPHHHRIHHRGHLGITGNADQPDGLQFTDRHGRPITTNRLIQPPNSPPPSTGNYQHPLGERLHTHWIHFNPPSTRPQRSDN